MNPASMPAPSDSVQPAGLPPRVIFVRQQFTPFGGGELILDRTITAMMKRGVRVSLLGRTWTGRDDIEFLPCDPPRAPRIWREQRFARAACKQLASETEALVQAHERIPCCDIFRAGDGVHAAFLEHRLRGRSALAHAALSLHPFHRATLALERDMFASRRLKAVLANSTMVADEIARIYSFPRDRIHLVPNGIDLSRFRPEAREQHRAAVRKRLGVDEHRPVALFVGSGFKRKGLDTAIAAVAAGDRAAELWAVGSDRKPHAYAAMAARTGMSDRFRLLGPVPDTLPYYGAADVLILPAVYDPFPSTVLEALACGLPVVTSTACGARDAVAKLAPALVRDPMDVAGLGEALDLAFELAASPDTASAARSIANQYSIETMTDRMLSVYRMLDPADPR